MNTFDIIRSRRSTRQFKPTPVEKKKLNQIIEAGRYAPSGGNSQNTHFIVITDPNLLDEIAALVQTEFAAMEMTPGMYPSKKSSIQQSKKGNYAFHYHAPALIITANKIDYPNHMADCACALENMMIMSNALDLGSCYINQLNWLNETPVLVDLFRRLGMKEDERIYGSLAIGYANTEDGLPNRTPLPRRGNPVTIIDPEFMSYTKAVKSRRQPIEKPHVVYQGEPGAFSETAAITFFGPDVHTTGLYNFEDTFHALLENKADYAVLPIENSSTGGIRQVYDLLEQYDFFIVGETSVDVSQNLMVLPGTRLEDITTVYSHEQGLFQCEAYLNHHKEWKKVPQVDTAGSAKMVAELQDPHIAAICSARAAEVYGLEIIAPSINHNKENTTRFIVLSPAMELRDEQDKMFLRIQTTKDSNSLNQVLSILQEYQMSVTKVESRPILGHNWQYYYYIEVEGSLLEEERQALLLEIIDKVEKLHVYGAYKANL